MNWILVALILAAIAIVAALSFYLGKLLMQIRYAKQQQQLKSQQKQHKLKEDIYTIAWAVQQQQCDLSEGCLRIWVLLDHLHPAASEQNQLQYPGIFGLYDKVKDLPTHDARKALTKTERRTMDKQRFSHEAELKSQIESDLDNLLIQFK